MSDTEGLLPDRQKLAFDAFVGFVYGTTISLVIKLVFDKALYKSPTLVVMTLSFIFFFAQDWAVRFRGRLQLKGRTSQNPRLYFLKLFLEIMIAFFLLFSCLELLLVFNSTIYPLSVLPSLLHESKVAYFIAAFAISSWSWNAVMIAISTDVNKEHVLALAKGTLHPTIISQFPIITKWQDSLRKREQGHIDTAMKSIRESVAGTTTVDSEAGLRVLETANDANHKLRSEYRKSLPWSFFHLIGPYAFVFHVVILNLLLGLALIFATRFRNGDRLLSLNICVTIALLVILPLVAALCLGHYFGHKQPSPNWERLGSISLCLFVLLVYVSVPAPYLMVLVAIQQLGANLFMSRYFLPSAGPIAGDRSSPPPKQTSDPPNVIAASVGTQ